MQKPLRARIEKEKTEVILQAARVSTPSVGVSTVSPTSDGPLGLGGRANPGLSPTRWFSALVLGCLIRDGEVAAIS
jgi:hypothetical protein